MAILALKNDILLIGIRSSTEKDISIKGLEIVKTCDKIYRENYKNKIFISFSSKNYI